MRDRCIYFFTGLLITALFSCKPGKQGPVLFEVLNENATGIHFANKLTPTQDFNVFKYMYFYNGAGIGAGDFNNDGLIDLFFAANQGKNSLYLNKGNLHFSDATTASGIPQDGGWSTGVSVVDINNDGLLDLYICRVGKHETLNSKNQLLICTGIDAAGVPHYRDEAVAYQLDFSGFSTQAVFFDYDGDGDLDMYLLNHSIHQNGTFGVRSMLLGKANPYSGDRIYRNDNGHFTDVTTQTGIHSSVIGYGLGINVSDINMDGSPDIYVGNDFHENDYLYINQRNGTFKEELNEHIMHTSQFSMGVDVADVNNDAYPDIITMDMLPGDPYILKRSLGEDEHDLFFRKLGYGYNYQYTRNNLQLNRKNGMFSEVGLYAGVYATDWSWAPLWMDMDNDGLKDLFITNGIPKRLNDIDYINYISDGEVQEKLRTNTMDQKDMALVDKFPQIKIPNKVFRNAGNLQFQDEENSIAGDRPTFSNGAVYADLDNDGDLDLVTNNIDDVVQVYENKTNQGKQQSPFVELKFKGDSVNRNAIGAKVLVYAGKELRTYEKYPVHGFLSSMEIPLHIGLQHTQVDSVIVIWPDNSCQRINFSGSEHFITLQYKKGWPQFDYKQLAGRYVNPSKPMEDVTAKAKLLHKHIENPFSEFDREPLIPHMFSTEGPALAVADINKDGLQDVFIGSSKNNKSAVFLQQPSGTFVRLPEPALDQDSTYENVDASWVDVNNDGNIDLVAATGGNEYYGTDDFMLPRVYLNDGHGNLQKLAGAFTNIFMNASCVAPCDVNGDGYADLFIGGRTVPWNYGQVPASYLLINDKTGRFVDATAQYSKDLSNVGFVTQALWFDLDKDGDQDLLLCLEWGGIVAFVNNKGHFTKKVLTDKKGWWNFILPADVDNDGVMDLVAGNLGLNSRLKATPDEPVRLYYADFDDNGKKEQILTYYLNGRELPFASKDELQRQIPMLKKRFLYAENFAKASLEDLLGASKLRSAQVLTADYFSNAILHGKGNWQFEVSAMPWEAQLSPMKTAVMVNGNNDSLPDILLAGNYYENNIQMGRYDADFGTMLLNKGHAQFEACTLNGLQLKGQVRHMQPITIAGKKAFILVKNDDSTQVIRFKETGNPLPKK